MSESAASADPIPAIGEREAAGDIARMFADIRATLGVPVVNLVWRHIAIWPGALEWTWGALRPLYTAGAVETAADQLRGRLALPDLPGLPANVLAAAGLSPDDLRGIRRVVDAYHRSNAMNLVALTALLARLDGTARPGSPPGRTAPERAIRIEAPLPPLLALSEMPPDLAALVRDLNALGERGDGRIIVSMYRQLAHWPSFLGLVWVLLAPAHRDGSLARAIGAGLELARGLASDLAEPLGEPPGSMPADTRSAIREAIAEFTDHPIGKMVVTCAVLRRALP